MKKTHLIAALMAVFVLILGVLVIDRSPPAKFVSGSIEPAEVAPGSSNARISRSVEWSRACPNTVTRYVTDVNGTQHKVGQFSAPVPDIEKCRKVTLFRDNVDKCVVNSYNPFPVNAGLPPGPAEYHVIVNFNCGFLGNWFPIRVDAPVLGFTVK